MTTDGLDAVRAQVLRNIEEHGYHLQCVLAEATSPSFAYTVGLARTNDLPELIIIGLPCQVAASLLSTIRDMLLEGTLRPRDGEVVTGIANFPLRIGTVPPNVTRQCMNVANWYYQHAPTPAIQVIWPDRRGIFPGEEGHDDAMDASQPILCSAFPPEGS